MNSTRTTSPQPGRGALSALLWGGLVCGALDITAAFLVYGAFGLSPIPLLQGIAAGLLGHEAFSGGLTTALLGLCCHFFIAFSAAGVYVIASRGLALLARRPLIAGPLYGIAVYFFMQLAVLPLSGAIKRPFSLEMTLIGVVIHIFCVGLPIALVTRRLAPR
jgi:uncharacterized membrane protein YagU involved in acid resistance